MQQTLCQTMKICSINKKFMVALETAEIAASAQRVASVWSSWTQVASRATPCNVTPRRQFVRCHHRRRRRPAAVPPPEGGAAPTRTSAPAIAAAPAPSPVRALLRRRRRRRRRPAVVPPPEQPRPARQRQLQPQRPPRRQCVRHRRRRRRCPAAVLPPGRSSTNPHASASHSRSELFSWGAGLIRMPILAPSWSSWALPSKTWAAFGQLHRRRVHPGSDTNGGGTGRATSGSAAGGAGFHPSPNQVGLGAAAIAGRVFGRYLRLPSGAHVFPPAWPQAARAAALVPAAVGVLYAAVSQTTVACAGDDGIWQLRQSSHGLVDEKCILPHFS
eukprot:COSAG01_NODE_4074_length_5381_cov_3.298183_2_plen_330_part_00